LFAAPARLFRLPGAPTLFSRGARALSLIGTNNMSQPTNDAEVLSAPLVIEYPFRRTLGPVLGAFFTGLRQGVVIGVRRPDGSVLVPPTEYDPATSEALSDLVEVGQAGVVESWAWVSDPGQKKPLAKPFAWALVKLDGAGTSMLHAVDVADESLMRTGMRVKIRWADERVGSILDIACFEPEEN
jgi:uncharacterized OB-fold protein